MSICSQQRLENTFFYEASVNIKFLLPRQIFMRNKY